MKLVAVILTFNEERHLARCIASVKELGQSALTPEADDRRFADPAWSQNPLYRRALT